MNPTSGAVRPLSRAVSLLFATATAVLALGVVASGSGAGTAARASVWFWLMLAPGYAAYRLSAGDDWLRAALFAAVASPVILSLGAVAGLFAGLAPLTMTRVLTVAAFLVIMRGILRPRKALARCPAREGWALALLLIVVTLAVALLPATREWWRMRSDAWFHAAVVAQIRDYGLPPDDPYFVGMPLQYMWFYHALVLLLADSLRIDAFRGMALVNIQALVGLGLAAYGIASVFRRHAAHRVAAAAVLLLGFNAAFWIFLPLKAVKAMIGEVRGAEELARTFALTPFNYDTACGFMNIYYNQEFFLDKFMVATAFGFALTCMTAAWAAVTEYLATRRRSALVLLALALIGMLGFHSLVGFVMLVGIFGGAVLTLAFRHGLEGLRVRDLIVILAVSLACFLAMTPYLHQVMHLKEREQVIPISFSVEKTAGIFISSAFVLFMAFRGRRFLAERTPAARMFVLGALSVAVFCLSIRLPGPNTYDKLGYFVFIPLSIIAGYAIADSVLSRRGARRRVLAGAAWALLFLAPVNVLAIAACFNTPDEIVVTEPEARLSAWVRAHTERGAVFIDDDDRVFLLVTGPRRYLWGWWAYASQWGYPRLEMARRYHARRGLYSPGRMDAAALQVLADVREPLYVVVRPGHRAAGASVVGAPLLFQPVYDDGDIALYRVDRDACREAAPAAPPAPAPEELIRESGL